MFKLALLLLLLLLLLASLYPSFFRRFGNGLDWAHIAGYAAGIRYGDREEGRRISLQLDMGMCMMIYWKRKACVFCI
jgi:hypothetical protein